MRNGEGEIFSVNEQNKFKGEFENNNEKNGEGIIIKEDYINWKNNRFKKE